MKAKQPYAPVFLHSARHFAAEAAGLEEAHATGGEPVGEDGTPAGSLHRIYVVNAIGNARSFLEANVNEFYHHLCDYVGYLEDGAVRDEADLPLDRRALELIGDLAAHTGEQFGRKPVLEKYQSLLVYAGAEPFDKGAQPYQDVALVTRLRNYFAHYEPEWTDLDAEGADRHRLATGLDARGVSRNPLATEGYRFPTGYLSADCAAWAIDSCLAFTDEFHERTAGDARYEAMRS